MLQLFSVSGKKTRFMDVAYLSKHDLVALFNDNKRDTCQKGITSVTYTSRSDPRFDKHFLNFISLNHRATWRKDTMIYLGTFKSSRPPSLFP